MLSLLNFLRFPFAILNSNYSCSVFAASESVFQAKLGKDRKIAGTVPKPIQDANPSANSRRKHQNGSNNRVLKETSDGKRAGPSHRNGKGQASQSVKRAPGGRLVSLVLFYS